MENSSKKCSKISDTENKTTQSCNARGRPVKSKVIQFTAQPKSIISQLLQKSINKAVQCKNSIDEHIFKQKEHGDDSPSLSYSYRSCDENHYRSDLSTHKKHSCEYPECTYSTNLSSNLKKHKRKHTCEKPYLCDQCSFRTSYINSLKVHKRIHTAERPYACKFCSYKSNSSSNLKKHCLHKHIKNS